VKAQYGWTNCAKMYIREQKKNEAQFHYGNAEAKMGREVSGSMGKEKKKRKPRKKRSPRALELKYYK